MSQSLTNAAGQWREPRAIAVAAARAVFAEVAPGEFQLMTAAEAAGYGGAARELVEAVPASGIYELTTMGEATALLRPAAVKIGSIITITS